MSENTENKTAPKTSKAQKPDGDTVTLKDNATEVLDTKNETSDLSGQSTTLEHKPEVTPPIPAPAVSKPSDDVKVGDEVDVTYLLDGPDLRDFETGELYPFGEAKKARVTNFLLGQRDAGSVRFKQ